MADSVHLGQVTNDAAAGMVGHRRRHVPPTHAPASFQQVLMRAFQGKAATGRFLGGNVHRAAARVPAGSHATKPASPPGTALNALSQAMALEGVPEAAKSDLAFIMTRESGGQVDAKSPVHSARGLFQLTAANYHYNPRGAASFGNAVEEAQGGIRYIRARYGTAEKAVTFWQTHHWY